MQPDYTQPPVQYYPAEPGVTTVTNTITTTPYVMPQQQPQLQSGYVPQYLASSMEVPIQTTVVETTTSPSKYIEVFIIPNRSCLELFN